MDFDDILKRMPEIAKAVNAFSSEIVQQQAFSALVNGLAAPVSDSNTSNVGSSQHRPAQPKTRKPASPTRDPATSTKRAGKKGKSPKIVTDLNLRPNSKTSLRDFIATKKPKDNQQRFAVITYYLQKTISIKNITSDHIYSAFKEIGEKVPLNIDGALLVTSRRKAWLDTSSLSDIKLTVAGENFVEHDLPTKAK